MAPMSRFFADQDTATGLSREHLCLETLESIDHPVHRDVLAPLLRFQEDAAAEGIDLRLVSGFRDFETQLCIWNAKASGSRPVLGDDSKPLDLSTLSEKELMFAILRWSALPGGSRHHWGTDIDVYDAAALPEGCEIQLVPEEYAPGGPFEKLGRWLEENCGQGSAEGFFRPYCEDRGGVAVEPWHLSHAPTAGSFEETLCLDTLRRALEPSPMRLKDAVLGSLTEIYRRYVRL